MQLSATAERLRAHIEVEQNNLFQRLALRGIEHVIEFFLDALRNFIDPRLGDGQRRFGAEEVQLDVAHVREDGGLDVRVLLVDGRDARVGNGFTDHGGLEGSLRDVPQGESCRAVAACTAHQTAA